MNDLFHALIESKRFWLFVTGLIVTAFAKIGVDLDPKETLAFVILIASALIGETIRPLARKSIPRGGRPKLFNPEVPGSGACWLIALLVCASMGCRPAEKPTPAPPLPTVQQQATIDQFNMQAIGYADAFALVAEEIDAGKHSDTPAMAARLTELTHVARLAAETPVLDEMNAHFPQEENGSWPSRSAVANYMRSLSDAYRSLKR